MSGHRTTPSFDIIATTRRRWSLEQKQAIVAEIGDGGATLSQVARRHGLHASQLFRWRADLAAAPAPEPETCTFDTMIDEFGLKSEPLSHLAMIVRGADTARLDLAPEAAGLLAASLGYSRMYRDDLEQLEAAMGFYDAFYRWCREATGETHNWPTAKKP